MLVELLLSQRWPCLSFWPSLLLIFIIFCAIFFLIICFLHYSSIFSLISCAYLFNRRLILIIIRLIFIFRQTGKAIILISHREASLIIIQWIFRWAFNWLLIIRISVVVIIWRHVIFCIRLIVIIIIINLTSFQISSLPCIRGIRPSVVILRIR